MATLNQRVEVNCPKTLLDDEQFYQFCCHNPALFIERNAQGTLIFLPPSGGETGNRQLELGGELTLWNRQTKLGKVFSSSTIFRLPNGASRSPDAAWIENSRWQALTPDQRQKFPPIAPDFVIELRSNTDRLSMLQDKMQEYIDSGVKLGWLINPQDQTVKIYRPDQAPETHPLPFTLSGENILPNFQLQLKPFTTED